MIANVEEIKWLLDNVSQYQISKNVDISQAAISLIKSGKRELGKLSLEKAIELTNYAKQIKGANE